MTAVAWLDLAICLAFQLVLITLLRLLYVGYRKAAEREAEHALADLKAAEWNR